MKWTHLDLFTGIGGMMYGLELTGKFRTIGMCEIEAFCQALLKEKKPDIPLWPDITKLNDYFEEALTSSPAAIPAKKTAAQIQTGQMTWPIGFRLGLNLLEPFAWFDQKSLSWRTPQAHLTEGFSIYSESLPKSGSMLNGLLYAPINSEPSTKESGVLLWPTPVAQDSKNATCPPSQAKRKNGSIPTILCKMGFAGSRLNPRFYEWMMGFPINWTELKDAATPSTLKSLKRWPK